MKCSVAYSPADGSSLTYSLHDLYVASGERLLPIAGPASIYHHSDSAEDIPDEPVLRYGASEWWCATCNFVCAPHLYGASGGRCISCFVCPTCNATLKFAVFMDARKSCFVCNHCSWCTNDGVEASRSAISAKWEKPPLELQAHAVATMTRLAQRLTSGIAATTTTAAASETNRAAALDEIRTAAANRGVHPAVIVDEAIAERATQSLALPKDASAVALRNRAWAEETGNTTVDALQSQDVSTRYVTAAVAGKVTVKETLNNVAQKHVMGTVATAASNFVPSALRARRGLAFPENADPKAVVDAAGAAAWQLRRRPPTLTLDRAPLLPRLAISAVQREQAWDPHAATTVVATPVKASDLLAAPSTANPQDHTVRQILLLACESETSYNAVRYLPSLNVAPLYYPGAPRIPENTVFVRSVQLSNASSSSSSSFPCFEFAVMAETNLESRSTTVRSVRVLSEECVKCAATISLTPGEAFELQPRRSKTVPNELLLRYGIRREDLPPVTAGGTAAVGSVDLHTRRAFLVVVEDQRMDSARERLAVVLEVVASVANHDIRYRVHYTWAA